MKLNWGHGIFIAIIICTGGISLLVYLSTQQKIDLVTEEYYPKELVYEEQITKIKNTNSLSSKVKVILDADSLFIIFPEIVENMDSIDGEIWFYFPANKYHDKKFNIELSGSYVQSFRLADFEKGKCDILLDWRVGKTEYFQRENIFLK